MKIKSFLNIGLILIIFLELLLFIYIKNQEKLLEIIILVYGGFVGTLIGVFLAFNLANKKQGVDQENVSKHYIKLIKEELKYNLTILTTIHKNLPYTGLLRKLDRNKLIIINNKVEAIYQTSLKLENSWYHAAISSNNMTITDDNNDILEKLQEIYQELSYVSIKIQRVNLDIHLKMSNTSDIDFSDKEYIEMTAKDILENINDFEKNCIKIKSLIDNI